MPSSSGANGRGRRVGLTRDQIVDAAVALIDRDGLDAFSLRRLAADIGVDPMSLYNHVANKDALFDGVVEVVMAEIGAAMGDLTGPWPDQIRQAAAAFRGVLLGHPHVSVIVLTRPVLSDVPLEVLRRAVNPALDAGLPFDEAVLLLRTFTSFLTGAILRELGSAMTFGALTPERVAARVVEIESSGEPLLAEAATVVASIDHERLFTYGVELLIAGLTATLGEPGR